VGRCVGGWGLRGPSDQTGALRECRPEGRGDKACDRGYGRRWEQEEEGDAVERGSFRFSARMPLGTVGSNWSLAGVSKP
jgi:hypothetical protein